MATTTLKIDGMTCGHCVQAVTNVLKGTEGVRDAQVDLQAGRARVEYEESSTNPGDLAAVVADEGYPAEPLAS
ncbi:MAG: heavy-metal-associated domain-containing protein [Gemmatimonadota bacterium]|nr:heavy-metal-associated domain-containing protein [Gemmatimonadota bacterium]